MFWLQRNSGNSIDKLLENPETTLNQVLKDSSFTNASHNPSKTLTNFLLSEKNFKKLINLALTNDSKSAFDSSENTENNEDKEKRMKEYFKLQRSAVSALTSQSKLIQNELSKSDLLKERLSNFPNSDYSSDSKICGYYSRIVASLLRASNGDYLYQLPNILDFLISKVNLLPCREFFVAIFCEFTTIFIKSSNGVKNEPPKVKNTSHPDSDSLDEDDNEDTEDSFDILTTKEQRDAFTKKLLFSDKINSGESTFFIFSAINGIFAQSSDLIRYFATLDCFKQILTIATSPEQKQLGAIEAFKAASQIMNWSLKNVKKSQITNDEITSVVDEIEPKFNLSKRSTIDGITAFSAEVFSKSAAQLITKLFDDDTNTFLNDAIIRSFKKLHWNDQLRLVNENDLIHRIILAFVSLNKENDPNNSTYVMNDNGHITELAQFLNMEFDSQKKDGRNNVDCQCFEAEEWKNFVENILKPHIKARDTFDNVRSSSESSDFEGGEDGFDDYEIEEEEEEEAFSEQLDMSDDEDENQNQKSQLRSFSDDDDDEEGGKEVSDVKTKVTKTDTSINQNQNENE